MLATATCELLAPALTIEDNRNYQLVVGYTGPLKAPVKWARKLPVWLPNFWDGTELQMPLYAEKSCDPS